MLLKTKTRKRANENYLFRKIKTLIVINVCKVEVMNNLSDFC